MTVSSFLMYNNSTVNVTDSTFTLQSSCGFCDNGHMILNGIGKFTVNPGVFLSDHFILEINDEFIFYVTNVVELRNYAQLIMTDSTSFAVSSELNIEDCSEVNLSDNSNVVVSSPLRFTQKYIEEGVKHLIMKDNSQLSATEFEGNNQTILNMSGNSFMVIQYNFNSKYKVEMYDTASIYANIGSFTDTIAVNDNAFIYLSVQKYSRAIDATNMKIITNKLLTNNPIFI